MILARTRTRAVSRATCAFRRTASCAPEVHPTAVVEPGAVLADGARIGPYCVVFSGALAARVRFGRPWPESDSFRAPAAAGARVGRRTRLDSHVSLAGAARVGDDCRLRPFSSVGGEAQDKRAAQDTSGEAWLGDRVMVGSVPEFQRRQAFWRHVPTANPQIAPPAACARACSEHVTVNRGTGGGGGVTRVGDECWLLAGSHVAHDAALGRAVVLSNHAAVAGHVTVGDGAVLGGGAGVRQKVAIGRCVSTASVREDWMPLLPRCPFARLTHRLLSPTAGWPWWEA